MGLLPSTAASIANKLRQPLDTVNADLTSLAAEGRARQCRKNNRVIWQCAGVEAVAKTIAGRGQKRNKKRKVARPKKPRLSPDEYEQRLSKSRQRRIDAENRVHALLPATIMQITTDTGMPDTQVRSLLRGLDRKSRADVDEHGMWYGQ